MSFGWFDRLIGKPKQQFDPLRELKKFAENTLSVDIDDPAKRTGVSLYLVLSRQFELIGKREGEFPFVDPFASDKARGALLGTAFAIVKHEFGETPNKEVIDAAIAAFTLAFGTDVGTGAALQTIRDASEGNEEINFASDWAIKDARTSLDDNSPASPAAYYLAVAEMM